MSGKSTVWSPISLTAVRSVFAAISIGICRRGFRFSKEKANWFPAVFVASTALLYLSAIQFTTAANAIVIQYIMPVFVILINWLKSKQAPKFIDSVFCVLMLMGVVLCFISGFSQGNLIGDCLALLSAMTYACVYLSAGKKDCNVLDYTYQGCVICLLLFIYIPFDSTFLMDIQNIASAGLMGVCVGFGYVCFANGFMKKMSSVSASIVSYIEPVLNPIWVFIVIGEKLELLSVLGSAIVLSMAVLYGILNKK